MAKLAAYQAKRDFRKTPEPSGADEATGDGFAFVVQMHDATRLHYDLRLELDGVMKSWAVTRGPSLVPGDKRLSVHTEDHPLGYNTFEGTIPDGEYGGGTVLIWDRGRWEPEGDPHRAYAKGHLTFTLHGEKLGGAWHLVRMRRKPREKQEAWLLIKSEDAAARPEGAPDILEEAPRSVASGRTLAEIAADPDGRVWHSAPGADVEPAEDPVPTRKSRTPRAKSRQAAAVEPRSEPAGPKERSVVTMPKTVEPALATPARAAPEGPAWLHEIKWDGYRLLAFKGRHVRLATRRGLDWTSRFPAIATALEGLPVDTAIVDGEAVVEDANGVPSFSALQEALSDEGGRIAHAAVFQAFDLLFLDGVDLRPLPLGERKARLAALIPAGSTGTLRFSEHLDADGAAMLGHACRLGLEGVISKRRDKPYRSGRTDDWLKVKCTDRQEFVVGGFVPATTGRRAVGSLLLGYNEGGGLRLAGRSGTGFTAESARRLFALLEPDKRRSSPFAGRLTAEEKRGAVFVEPKHVAEIEFRSWTGDRHLRHAAFKGLREDKAAHEVVRETPDAADAARPDKPGKRRHGAAEDAVAGVRLTHPDRILWDDGTTKAGLARFYEGIAPWILPHLVGRPLSLLRCPGGASETCFFQKHAWAGLTNTVRRETVRDETGEEEVLFVEDLAGLVQLVQANVLEIHPWGSRVADIDRPDRITMDLDPGDDVSWEAIVAGALDVRERLRTVGLESFVKTTGGKGLHVVVPLSPSADWVTVKGFAKALADGMEADSPRTYIAKATKAARRGLIYVDYLRNGRGATAVAAYSTRAREGAPVSVPVGWDELGPALRPNGFTVSSLPARLRALRADPWAEIDRLKQKLPGAAKARPRTRR